LGEVVAAAVVLAPNSRLRERDITAFLRDRIALVKLPRTFVFVDRIPRGPSGKPRRSELVARFETLGPVSPNARSPHADEMATPTEARLAQLWKWLLQKDELGPDDDFFLVGWDSAGARCSRL